VIAVGLFSHCNLMWTTLAFEKKPDGQGDTGIPCQTEIGAIMLGFARK